MPKKLITLFDYFEKNLSKNKFIFELETKRKKYHNEVLKSSNDIYMNQNFKRGEKLSIILPNSILFIEYFLASLKAGCIFNPIPYFTSIYELKKIFSFIKPTRIITDRKDIFDNFSGLYQVTMSSEVKNKKLYNQIKLKNYKKDIVAIYYSSGTTGNPKGVMYSNKNMVSLISSINRCFKL
jgi:acyl-CoA synthetase (AMP-forming)/AMP-acid ligase II